MSYQCKACGRRLNLPAYIAPASLGGWVLGPVCLSKAGLQVAKKRRAAAGPPPRPGRQARAAPSHGLPRVGRPASPFLTQ